MQNEQKVQFNVVIVNYGYGNNVTFVVDNNIIYIICK